MKTTKQTTVEREAYAVYTGIIGFRKTPEMKTWNRKVGTNEDGRRNPQGP